MESCLQLLWRTLRWPPRVAGKLGVYRILIVTLILGTALPTQAQSILNMVMGETQDALPPPPGFTGSAPGSSTPASAPAPSVPAPSAPSNFVVVPPTGIPPMGTVAQANPATRALTPAYRILVDDRAVSLAQAKQIEPQAFITTIGGQQWIQVGAFSTQNAAFQQVQRFAKQGISTRVIGANDSPQRPPNSQTTMPTGYYVVVPVAIDQVNPVARRLVNLGVSAQYTQLRDKPLGLHFSIGTYADRKTAEQLSDYLRSDGELDARVFYQP